MVNDELTSEMDRAVGRAGTDNKLRDDFMRSEVILMDARREGYLEGCESGEKRAVLKLFREGAISEEQACRELGITTEEFEKLTESE